MREKLKNSLWQKLVMGGFVGFDSNGKSRPKPFRISLKSTILPEHFGLIEDNFKFNQQVFLRSTRNNASIRTKMTKLQSAINTLENKYVLADILPEPNDFKNDLLIELGRNKKEIVEDKKILDYLYDHIKSSEADSGLSKRDSITQNTIKTYKTVSHLVENYQLATKEKLTFQNFDKSKYWYFWEIQDEILKDNIKIDNPNQPKKQRKQPHGYLVNSLRKYQTTFAKVLKNAYEDGIEMVLNVYDKNLVLEKVDSSKDIYVTELEIQKIIDADVAFNEDLQMAKDYLIIGSLTGMRYESMFDTKNSKVKTFKEDGYCFDYIHSKQNKTKTEVYMPLLKPVKEILAKTENKFPIVKSNSVINKKLKELFKHLKIDSLEDVTLKTYRSDVIHQRKEKHQLISTHDCKKTFYTNLFNNKVNPVAIDNMTHPDATPQNRMAKVYNKSNMLDKAKMFVDEINKIDSKIYSLE
tara:strand:+ start:548 stop:1948 length:1401 start_codon:yes stop_codon:yes gene_type:complete